MYNYKRMDGLGKVLQFCEWRMRDAVVELLYVNCRILWVTFRFSKIKLCVVVGYGSTKRYGEERKWIWNFLW